MVKFYLYEFAGLNYTISNFLKNNSNIDWIKCLAECIRTFAAPSIIPIYFIINFLVYFILFFNRKSYSSYVKFFQLNVRFTLSYICMSILVLFMKHYFAFSRPICNDLKNCFSSFPSGHVAVTTIFLIVFIKSIYLRFFFITLISYSRIILQDHYFSDTVYGFFVGVISLYLMNIIYGRSYKFFRAIRICSYKVLVRLRRLELPLSFK